MKSRNRRSGQTQMLDIQLTPTKVYPTKQAAGKALQRLRVKLPNSPRKRKALALKLALEEGNTSLEILSKSHSDAIGQDIQDRVSDFYVRDDISWAAPGMRDSGVLKMAVGGKKVVKKRFLTMNIMEAYQLFNQLPTNAF